MGIVRYKVSLQFCLIHPERSALDTTAQFSANDFAAKYQDQRAHAHETGAICRVVADESADFHVQACLFVDFTPPRLRWMLAPAHKTTGENILAMPSQNEEAPLILHNYHNTAKGRKVSKEEHVEDIEENTCALTQESIEVPYQHQL